MIEVFPRRVSFTVIDDVSNKFVASNGSFDLCCVTPEGEKIRVDMITASGLPDVTDPADLLGKTFTAEHFSTALYFADTVTEIKEQQ